ncbi:multisubunit sodium/proton antiporter MrpC subunit [Litorimonas taeanensis]|uniref:Multisubunit sodium/proton antiporter MrpC subunit n=1 Tax=Litorimonas taeanensis TaxID=568099 RepID=A0A420WIP6_9PROT|nr:cation:proton antiporter subunit C [Litorimonas taeanensis]RKQ70890.1 multisubunit sodium/proton antiporter MrpC subunit [Litorimonas taeanensis]
MLADIFQQYNYAIVIILMMTGLYTVFSSRNLIKKLVGLSIFQTSVFLLYITIGKVANGQPPILEQAPGGGHGEDHAYTTKVIETVQVAAAGGGDFLTDIPYSNPLPHVLILTAIVVGVATLAIGLSLVVRIREVYQTIEEDRIDALDYAFNLEGTDTPKKAGAKA